jgi:lantibiotic modifying enzyme
MSSDGFLAAAAAIGRGIVAHAVWHEGRCSWVGAVGQPELRSRPEVRPVGPFVYDGTAGIGLFLAQLAAVTGDASLHRTAAGALRHAVERAAAPDPDARNGLYVGVPGIAWAAERAAALIGDEEIAARARALPSPPPRPGRCPDLMEGTAGTLVALLGHAAAFDDRRRLASACELGEALLADARVTRHGWSWDQPARRHPQHLCGVAHGAGGIGWALLELHSATGDARFREAAAGAFAYERSWLDGTSGAWPDLRRPARRGEGAAGMTATWCYGEAGIALSRLRADELLRDAENCSDADIAVETTRRHLALALPYAIDDLSLCHGLGGAAEALIAAGDRAAAIALGEVALERHGDLGDWPCGVYGSTPGLFRGLSGIGWLFLRLHDPGTPSPLALPPAVDTGPHNG